MLKNELIAKTENKKKNWPADCIWPEPVKDGEGSYWEAEDAEALPLDTEGEYFLEIKEYMDSLAEDGRLNDDYTVNSDYEETEEDGEKFIPEKGEEYWDENGFDIEYWEENLVSHLNNLKLPLPSPVDEIQRIIGYEFINENILRQAFTRRAFALEYGVADNEVLEFYGDSALNTVITREMARQTTETESMRTHEPFVSKYNEGELTIIKQHYVSRDYLSSRAAVLGLDQYILYGTGEEASESSLEDVMEALIGAVAVDSEWNWYAIEAVVDKLICFQISGDLLKQSYYDLFNAWHQRKFGCLPDYEVSKGTPIKNSPSAYQYCCTLRYSVPQNDKDIWTGQRVDVQEETRSKARERAAEKAYSFLVKNGLWMNLSDAGITPALENSINQLQELYQKKYVEKPEYTIHEDSPGWHCVCTCSGLEGWGRANGKTQAKKKAAFMVLVRLMKSAGLATKEMDAAMWESMRICE